jgi:hypothetical protein
VSSFENSFGQVRCEEGERGWSTARRRPMTGWRSCWRRSWLRPGRDRSDSGGAAGRLERVLYSPLTVTYFLPPFLIRILPFRCWL